MSERRSAVDDEPINWRRTATGVTIYDEREPDAWIHVDLEAAVPPGRQLLAICPECGAVLAHRSPPGSGTVCGECDAAYDHPDGDRDVDAVRGPDDRVDEPGRGD